MAKPSLPSYDAGQYWTSRDFHTSARLHLQHWLWNYQLGYVLHPAVPRDNPNLKVADVAAGNGAWTIELASLLPSSATLSGFDITASNYPAPEWLPSNVSMHVLDAFTPELPENLLGAFDIVHVRAIASAIKGNAVEPLLGNLVKMLIYPEITFAKLKPFSSSAEPGGHLQWDEGNPDKTTARSPRPQVSTEASCELLALLDRFGKMFGMNTEWLISLPETLEAHGMDVIDHAQFEPKKELSKAWTDDLLLVYEEIQWSVPKAADAGPNPALTREMYQDLFARVLKETERGVSLSMDGMVILSRKKS